MKKLTRKPVIIALAVVLCILVAIGYAVTHTKNSLNPNCKDVVGDGYAMGTDPHPVVIGNTCDQ